MHLYVNKNIEREYDDSFSPLEISGYCLILFCFLLSYGYLEILYIIPFFLFMFRASLWDYKYKLVPLPLLVMIFFSSFFATSNNLYNAAINGLVVTGAIFMLNQIVEMYIDFKYPDNNGETFMGEGDIIVIGAIGVIFGSNLLIFLSCLLFAGIIHAVIGLLRRERVLPFIPALFTSTIFHFFYQKEILNFINTFFL